MILEAIIVIAGITAAISLLMLKRLSKSGHKKEIAIEALSTIWTKHKNVTLSIEELVGIWKDKNGEPVEKEKEVQYKHKEIQELYEMYLKGRTYSASSSGDLIREILTLLDEEGDCPSVVNTKGEPEGLIAKNSYDVLSKVPLYKHSINVTEQMIKAFRNSASMLPKVLITSLGHDLGKLPSARKNLYSMGDHPLISITILERYSSYKELPFRDEISKAILEHHRVPKGILAEKLKEADHAARRMEMAEMSEGVVSETPVQPKEAKIDMEEQATIVYTKVYTKNSSQAEASSSINPPEQSSKIDGDIFSPPSGADEKEKNIPKEMLLEWFNAEVFIKELKPYINRLYGERWNAFSMPDGYIYFQTGVIEEVAKKLGKDDPNIALMDSSREMKQSIMFTIIQRLRREKDAIARGLIKDNYFGGRFSITMSNGKTIDGYFTPFVAEAFGEQVSFFEVAKQKKLKEVVKVEPLVTSQS